MWLICCSDIELPNIIHVWFSIYEANLDITRWSLDHLVSSTMPWFSAPTPSSVKHNTFLISVMSDQCSLVLSLNMMYAALIIITILEHRIQSIGTFSWWSIRGVLSTSTVSIIQFLKFKPSHKSVIFFPYVVTS